ncbi:MAG: hypothetical protein CEN91_555 [Candidatus Berkelbacteria bacterium Licking1014_85]|uniref:Uncharacterized protein n=1 Tax=Candidatus Berkelbacteria bacterium Licking1014_85 TaxID=2017148 RepID=A0A554LH00_9BACT|nr:MAG: hypothetical protein CEN91_555 [Candidatus Berkelbacteria bacterium Licking1014_85]
MTNNQYKIPTCPVCGKQIYKKCLNPDRPVDIYDHCPRCKKWGLFFNIAILMFNRILIMTIILLIARLFWVFKEIPLKTFISSTGLIFDITGAVYLIGQLDRSLSAIGIWDAHKITGKELPIHSKRIRWGIILLVIGFIFQLMAQFVIK